MDKKTLNFSIMATNSKEIPLPEEVNSKSGYVKWGKDNLYPLYLYDLYASSSLFHSIVAQMIDYVMGNEIDFKGIEGAINRKGDNFEDFMFKILRDYFIYGGFSFQIVRNRNGNVAELNNMDFRRIRINEDEDTIYYTSDWTKTRTQPKIYKRFISGVNDPVSVFYYKGRNTYGVYPIPMYQGCITSLEIHSQISQYHLNNILNNFTPAAVLNFNNGDGLSEDVMDEIEQNIYNKFIGTENAGRFILSFNADKEHSTTIERLADDGLENKYTNLYTTVVKDIYQGFRTNKILLGVDDENTGFSKSAYLEAFALYQKTVISPIQKEIVGVFEKVFGIDCMYIKPFQIDWSKEDEGDVNVISETDEIID